MATKDPFVSSVKRIKIIFNRRNSNVTLRKSVLGEEIMTKQTLNKLYRHKKKDLSCKIKLLFRKLVIVEWTVIQVIFSLVLIIRELIWFGWRDSSLSLISSSKSSQVPKKKKL